MTRQLHAEERGSGADTIVLLHGFAACAAIWRASGVSIVAAAGAETAANDTAASIRASLFILLLFCSIDV